MKALMASLKAGNQIGIDGADMIANPGADGNPQLEIMHQIDHLWGWSEAANGIQIIQPLRKGVRASRDLQFTSQRKKRFG